MRLILRRMRLMLCKMWLDVRYVPSENIQVAWTDPTSIGGWVCWLMRKCGGTMAVWTDDDGKTRVAYVEPNGRVYGPKGTIVNFPTKLPNLKCVLNHKYPELSYFALPKKNCQYYVNKLR